MNRFGHIDLRVNDLERDLPFYEKLLPELGFTRTFHSANWKVFAADGELPSAAYFAITEDREHRPNANLIGFWAQDREEVDRLAKLIVEIGGAVNDGPRLFPISPTYYAVYFEDPCGNKYELLHRLN
ncbi:VOC family protein [Cohnella thailandensis]|jgi:Predicted lactoylglutathione lyase|uniref:VOC family protein n=1 Tax=Cohnella thailandensis TaxID=557557 RepID=A0A841SV15_9BACL|nr:VOC family protein [Cohnella thailandensis]MBB6635754.1 VOC family protein [Cohnella thailandensis]MBP1976132.1 putative lactoylglutathione lyase [Cohnella thailandensis]